MHQQQQQNNNNKSRNNNFKSVFIDFFILQSVRLIKENLDWNVYMDCKTDTDLFVFKRV